MMKEEEEEKEEEEKEEEEEEEVGCKYSGAGHLLSTNGPL